MKKLIIFLILISFLVTACKEKPIGGETDEHGCLPAAGYTWCESKQKCLRTWEEECSLTIEQAIEIAQNSECAEQGILTNNYFYNDATKTWWIDLELEKPGCAPACVIKEETKTAEINWRCTGVIVD